MAEAFVLNATIRSDKGKGASRRLRRLQNLVPAIIYGGKKDPQPITIAFNELVKQLENEATYSHILTLKLDGDDQKVVLKDLQRHPAKNDPMHADFLRVDDTQKLHMNVPLHFINEESCRGVKSQGAVIAHQMAEIEISCLPRDLPEFIEVDMQDIDAGETVHLSDIKLSDGVSIVALSHGEEHDLPIASVNIPRGSSEDDENAIDSDENSAEGDTEGGAPTEE